MVPADITLNGADTITIPVDSADISCNERTTVVERPDLPGHNPCVSVAAPSSI